MDRQPYVVRFLKKLWLEVQSFLSGQQIITALLLAIAAVVYQFIQGRLSLDALKDNVVSVAWPFIWIVCGFGCYYSIIAAIHIHREAVAETEAYRPRIREYRLKRPSRIPGVIASCIMVIVLGTISYWSFVAAYPIIGLPNPPGAPSAPDPRVTATRDRPSNRTQEMVAELSLLPPVSRHLYGWIPDENPGLTEIPLMIAGAGPPVFGLRNLSSSVITGITVDWSIVRGIPIRHFFLSNDHFKRYHARVTQDGLRYELRNASGKASGRPTADSDSTNIPYCFPNGASDQKAIDVSLPLTISHSYALRVVGTTPRPAGPGDDNIRSDGPTILARISYAQGVNRHSKTFRIESWVESIPDNAGVSQTSGIWTIDSRLWFSPSNFRAVVNFSVTEERRSVPEISTAAQ